MAVYTHNTADSFAPMTFVKLIVSDAPRAELGIDDTWFEVDAQEVADIEELCDRSYAEYLGLSQIDMRRASNGEPIRRYGRL